MKRKNYIVFVRHLKSIKDLLDNVLNTTGVQRNILKRLLISEKMILRRWSDDYQELQI